MDFKPGDYHVMLSGLMRALKFGENFGFTLHFAKAGEITLTAGYQSAVRARFDSPPGQW